MTPSGMGGMGGAGAGITLLVSCAQTHASVLMYLDDRVYKLKKRVDLGFLDHRTRASRRRACDREVELNRRFAPDVYLGVVDVLDRDGTVCDHAVVMRRMPPRRRLAGLVRTGEALGETLREVARLLAARHAASPRTARISAQGSGAALLSRWQASFEQLRPLHGSVLDTATATAVEELAGEFVGGRGPLFAERIRDGRIVDGHGDLQADDIFALDDGPRVLDCLDFDDRLRWLDGLDDAAFLAMDLEHLGVPELGAGFLRDYARFAGDPAPQPLVHHYTAYRAFVRAKVHALRARQGARRAKEVASTFAALAREHLVAGRVLLVAVGGLPGSGKSTLAAALADRLGAVVVGSDPVRKELAGLPPKRPAPAAFEEGIYHPRHTARVYAELLRRAGRFLGLGQSVVLDATWTAERYRDDATEAARRARVPLVPLWCQVEPATGGERIRRRAPGPSDADESITAELAARSRPWPGATHVDTSGGAARAMATATEALDAARARTGGPHGHGGS